MKESILSIAQWHKDMFPDATLDGQRLKWMEEKREWKESLRPVTKDLVCGDVKELADMFIVACGLTRFSDAEAMFCFSSVVQELYSSLFTTSDLENAIDEKMEHNRARIWEKQANGSYHHVDDDKQQQRKDVK